MNREQAEKRVGELKDYYTHLSIYLAVNIFLFIIDVRSGSDWWFYFPLFGWGIGIVAHTLWVFGFGRDWEEKKIRELMKEK